MNTSKLTKYFTAIALTASFSGGSFAIAQPDLNSAPKAVNPTNRPPRDQQWLRRIERRQQQQQERRAQMVRQGLTRLGFTDEALHKDVLAHFEERDKLDLKLQGWQFQVAQTLATGKEPELATLLTEYKKTTEDHQTKVREADAALNNKIKYSENAKLELALRLVGAIGETSDPTNTFFGLGRGQGGNRDNRRNAQGGRNRRNRQRDNGQPQANGAPPANVQPQ